MIKRKQISKARESKILKNGRIVRKVLAWISFSLCSFLFGKLLIQLTETGAGETKWLVAMMYFGITGLMLKR